MNKLNLQKDAQKKQKGKSLTSVIKNLSIALHVSSDKLIFGDHERNPEEEVEIIFEAVKELESEAKNVVKDLLEAFIMKQEVKKWSSN
ncbi:hypothetical protein SCG7109_AE_00190 [Chlamydiales bacterium SCGC AG-110-M15]|nr:hypothetical protein SCG7109_AE_00190 [Chlamydiales bacterium SCGC AG-110-M15]